MKCYLSFVVVYTLQFLTKLNLIFTCIRTKLKCYMVYVCI